MKVTMPLLPITDTPRAIEPLFPLGEVQVTTTLMNAILEHGWDERRLGMMLHLHSILACGCVTPSCQAHELEHVRLGGTVTTCHTLVSAPVMAGLLSGESGIGLNHAVVWIQTAPDRSFTACALSSDLDWSGDPIEPVHQSETPVARS